MSSREQVKAYHILIKHQGSLWKASWKDPEGRVISNTTKEAAITLLESIREDIVFYNAKFEDVARELSDCSSAKRDGDLDIEEEDLAQSSLAMLIHGYLAMWTVVGR